MQNTVPGPFFLGAPYEFPESSLNYSRNHPLVPKLDISGTEKKLSLTNPYRFRRNIYHPKYYYILRYYHILWGSTTATATAQ